MEFNQRSCLHIMRHIAPSNSLSPENYNNIDRVMELIGTVVDRGIQHLEVTINCRTMNNLCGNSDLRIPGCRCYRCVSIYPGCRYYLPRQNIYNSKTLVSLKLVNVELPYPECAVSLPCLKIMMLIKIFSNRDGPLILEKLISGCHVLEDLELCLPSDILNESDARVVVLFRLVCSQTLKKCRLGFSSYRIHTDFTVEIDAPRLEYLSLVRIRSDRIVVKNLSSLLKIELLSFEQGSPCKSGALRERDFLANISSVRHIYMIITTCTLQVFYSKLGLIPKFHNLYNLEACLGSLQFLPALLESCPNLKILSLVNLYSSEEPRQIDFTSVPRCLISTLENVEIKKQRMTDETVIIKLVNYFLENSAVLKKLTLDFFKDTSITNQEAESYKKLITSAKLSLTCQVIIDTTQCSKKRSR